MVIPDRVTTLGTAQLRPNAHYVLYWMTAARRSQSNFALDRALGWCRTLNLPLLVMEGIRLSYPYASDRLHTFVLQGMADNARSFGRAGVRYIPFVEREAGQGKGLLRSLAEAAAIVVTDDYPAFFLPRMLAAAAAQLAVPLEAVDSNGLLPMRASDQEFTRAVSFRRHLQTVLPDHLAAMPHPRPLSRYEHGDAVVAGAVPGQATAEELAAPAKLAASLPIDHEVGVVSRHGGAVAGQERLKRFVGQQLADYDESRNHPDAGASSGLSPWLHFGHVGAHQVLLQIADHYGWSPARLGGPIGGAREGWWGLPPTAEAFADQVFTWRELGFNLCATRRDYAAIASLPAWARKTIAEHENDPRQHLYTREQLEAAATADPVWNAAQTELRTEGRLHNYLRMLWGKHIYAWSPSAKVAMDTMIHLNDRWALDGRDPNSYSGIGWVLGRYDRAWGPERPVYGKLRYMTSESARRKLRLRRYLERYGAQTAPAAMG